MASKNSQRQCKDNIHVMSLFPILRKCMLILALIQYRAMTLEGHRQQVGTCLQRSLKMIIHSHNTRTLCSRCRKKQEETQALNLCFKTDFQHIQAMTTKCFADITGAVIFSAVSPILAQLICKLEKDRPYLSVPVMQPRKPMKYHNRYEQQMNLLI